MKYFIVNTDRRIKAHRYEVISQHIVFFDKKGKVIEVLDAGYSPQIVEEKKVIEINGMSVKAFFENKLKMLQQQFPGTTASF